MKLLLIILFLAGCLSLPAAAQIYVAVDGDTIAVGQERIRVLGIDTPETFEPQCEEESRLGYQAAGRLQKLLNTRRVRVERTDRRDKYGRTLARVFVGKDDVADLLVREGLARAYTGGKRGPWCPQGQPRESSW